MLDSKRACDDCRKDMPTALHDIGEPVRTEDWKSYTDYRFMQCERCGSVWVIYEEGGLGGHGRFQLRLTDHLF